MKLMSPGIRGRALREWIGGCNNKCGPLVDVGVGWWCVDCVGEPIISCPCMFVNSLLASP